MSGAGFSTLTALLVGAAAVVIGVVVLAIGVLNAAADGVQPGWFAGLFDTRERGHGEPRPFVIAAA